MNLRSATQQDEATIKAMIRAAKLNPIGLDWRRFVVAEHGGQVVGIGQVKPHGDGSRELASLAVLPEWHSQGVGSTIVTALLAQSSGTLFLTCESKLVGYYQRFGFRQVGRSEMTPFFRRLELPFNLVLTLIGAKQRLAVMRHDG